MKQMAWLSGAASFGLAVWAAGPALAGPTEGLSLEQIMADPDWIGAPVRDPYWAADGRSVYYSLKRSGSPLIDLHRITLPDRKDGVVGADAMADIDAAAVYDPGGRRAAFVRNGDVFVRDLPSGRLMQITRTPEVEAAPQFSADGARLSFRVDNDWFVFDFKSRLTFPVAIVKAEKDPDAPPPADDLRDMQLRTFGTLKRLREETDLKKQQAAALREADPTRSALPFYLGDEVRIRATVLSPDARWLVVVTTPKAFDKGKEGKLTRYVTESGYEEFETERLRVGRNPPPSQSLLLLNLADHTVQPLALDALPGIHDDPLKAVREENARASQPLPAAAATDSGTPAPAAGAPGPSGAPGPPGATAAGIGKARGVWIFNDEPEVNAGGIHWSRDAKAVAVQIFSIDNKDRWLASIDLATHTLVPQQRCTDDAWVNQTAFNDFGWLDDRTLWYESEESGYAHLYAKPLGGAARALTSGQFEVSEPVLSADGRWFYVLSNATAAYSYDVYRLPSGGGTLQRITRLQGVERFALNPRADQLLVTHSSPYLRSQLAVVGTDGSPPRELTDTRGAQYRSLSWIEPEIIQVPSTHFAGSIPAKLYRDATWRGPALRPAVLFVHGAGYLQDVHLRYSYYFREQMFNNWLARHGYVVLDMDYRASAGYGRDWRTAIYRQMGHPELEDLLDGKQWLVEHAGVDSKRVGLYGGSYGGFMTLMALFRAPEAFAAGAALRPVTDWMQYDHGYTSAILNDPEVDPLAYQRSSPIEFAAGLRAPLLIAHGVIDDNVLFEDSMRLYERLIELHKDNFTISPYPLDRHGFTNADSWLDEYKRIYRLFEANLK